jgi:tRNA U54 and U55 pseudouridine synthase Pus10
MPENRFTQLFKDADAAFNGKHKKELNELQGLSKEEVDAITPGTEDLRVYSVLIKVVEQASKDNLSQAQLIEDIRELGDIAVTIAKKIPKFTNLF